MSAIDPEKQAIVQELVTRRSSLDPEKQAIVDELSSRLGVNNPMANISPQELAARQAQSKATFEANQPSLVRGFLRSVGENVSNVADIKQNFKNLGSAIMNPTSGNVATGMESTGNVALDALATGLGGYGLVKGVNAIPRLGRAGEAFSTLMGTLENNPVTQGSKLAAIGDAIANAKKLGKSGVALPPVVKAAEDALTGSTPITYGDLRGLAQTAGQKVGILQRALNPPDPRMETAVGRLYGSLTDAAKSVADDAGLGNLYDRAINEYRQASNLRSGLKKAALLGIGASGLGGAYKALSIAKDTLGY